MKLQLPSVTLICVDSVDPQRANIVLEYCKLKADFGDVKLLTHEYTGSNCIEIKPLTSLIMYSVFMLTRLHEYIDTPNLLIVQRDGWILNPDSFDMGWLGLDYIGCPFMQYDKVGSGGFSLRSKRIMDHAADILPKWDGTERHANELQYGNLKMYEDGVLCMDKRFREFKIADLEQASQFGQGGNRNPKYFKSKPFGFHRTWQQIDFNTGEVDSSDLSRDLTISYDYDIDKLI